MVTTGATVVTQETEGSVTVTLPNQLNTIVTSLQDSRKHTHLCDVTISVGGQCYYSHKFLLVALSKFFHSHFFVHAKKSEIDIGSLRCVSKTTFELFLQFAYTSKLILQSLEDAKGMLKLAHGLDIASVREACCEFLRAKLNSDNCADVLRLAEEFNLANLVKQAQVLMHKKLIKLSETYMKLDAKTSHDQDKVSAEDIAGNMDDVPGKPATRTHKKSTRLSPKSAKSMSKKSAKSKKSTKSRKGTKSIKSTKSGQSTKPAKSTKSVKSTKSKLTKSSVVPSDALPGSRLMVETKAALKRFPTLRTRRSWKPALPLQIIHSDDVTSASEFQSTKKSQTTKISEMVHISLTSDDSQTSQVEPTDSSQTPNNTQTSNNSAEMAHLPPCKDSLTHGTDLDMTRVSSVFLTKGSRDCKLCDRKNFPNLKELQDHCSKEHVRCKKCRRLFSTRIHLRNHMAFHFKEGFKGSIKKQYSCSFCGKDFNYSSAWKVHLRTHTGDKPFQCRFCDQKFSQSINLYRHVLSYHEPDAPKYQCKICGKEFNVEIYLKSHEITHSEVRPFQCEDCGAMFKRKNDLRCHGRVHSFEKPHRCDLCLNCFKTAGDLKVHMQTHNDDKPYRCPQCARAFKRTGHLNRHMKTHSGVKPFKCEKCDAAFNRKENLNTHMRTHTDFVNYKCEECDAQFKHFSSLKVHSKKHWSLPERELDFVNGTSIPLDQAKGASESDHLPVLIQTVVTEASKLVATAAIEQDPVEDCSPPQPVGQSSLISTQPESQGGLSSHCSIGNIGANILYVQQNPNKMGASHTLISLSDMFNQMGETSGVDETAGLPIPVMALPKQDGADGNVLPTILVTTSGESDLPN